MIVRIEKSSQISSNSSISKRNFEKIRQFRPDLRGTARKATKRIGQNSPIVAAAAAAAMT
jgi:hypothetical protein